MTVHVVVNRIGQVVVKPEAASVEAHGGNVYLRGERVACGSSCAPSAEQYAGTLGALVRKASQQDEKDDNGQLFLLSNNHVLAAGNHTPVGMPILCPANRDARPGARAPGEVGRHAEIRELRSGDPELVPTACDDIAIATAVEPAGLSSWQGDDQGYDTPSDHMPPQSGVSVKKFGLTTGLTRGVVEAHLTSFPMPYKCRNFSAVVWFETRGRSAPATPVRLGCPATPAALWSQRMGTTRSALSSEPAEAAAAGATESSFRSIMC